MGVPGNRGEWNIEGGLLSGASRSQNTSKHSRAVSLAPAFQLSHLSSFPVISLVVSFRGLPRVVLRGYSVLETLGSLPANLKGPDGVRDCTEPPTSIHSSPLKDSRPRLVSV